MGIVPVIPHIPKAMKARPNIMHAVLIIGIAHFSFIFGKPLNVFR